MEQATYLVIDDSLTARMMLKALLESTGADVLIEETAASGTERARACRPDVAIIDVVLPDQDGVALCHAWQSDDSLRTVPVLLISGSRSGYDDRVVGLESGAMGYIVKPFHERELLAQVEMLRRLGRAQNALRHRFESAMRFAPVAMFLVGSDGRIRLANAQSEEDFRCGESELKSLRLPDLVEAGGQADPDELAEAIASGTSIRGDWTMRRSDGQSFPVELACRPIQSEDGPTMMCSVVDLSERARNEERLRQIAQEQSQLNAELTRRNTELRTFAHVVSHDLKAPLRAIGSLVDCVTADYLDVLDELGREQLSLIKGRTQRMYELIGGILRYSSSEVDTTDLQDVESGAAVQAVIESLAIPDSMEVSVAGELPVVRYSAVQLQQVFQNLIGNAVQHLDRPSGRIEVSAERGPEEICFTVEDDGPGIPAGQRERIFEVFQTLAPRDEHESVGVGLAIVAKIVDQNGGRVWVEPAPERGSRFRFTVPTGRDRDRGGETGETT